jgi:hypothetical protein
MVSLCEKRKCFSKAVYVERLFQRELRDLHKFMERIGKERLHISAEPNGRKFLINSNYTGLPDGSIF